MTGCDILNDDDETPEQIEHVKRMLCDELRVNDLSDADPRQVLFAREMYWKQLDRQQGWCFLCWQTQSFAKQDRFPDLGNLLSFMRNNYHTMEKCSFIYVVMDWYICQFYDQSRNLRGLDKITGQPIPPHWWWPEHIEDHILHHSLDPLVMLERTIKSNWTIQLELEGTMKKRNLTDGEIAYDTLKLKLYLEVQKQNQVLINRLAQARGSLNSKGL